MNNMIGKISLDMFPLEACMDVRRARAAHLCSQSPKRCIIITPFPYMRYANGLLALRNAMRQCEFDSHIIRGIRIHIAPI